jgi:hypothetical protein
MVSPELSVPGTVPGTVPELWGMWKNGTEYRPEWVARGLLIFQDKPFASIVETSQVLFPIHTDGELLLEVLSRKVTVLPGGILEEGNHTITQFLCFAPCEIDCHAVQLLITLII